MLDELVVTNLGIIESGHLEPSEGLTVITGETGTGKTLLLGAVRLLLGGASRPELIGPFGEEAIAEGRFVFDDGTEVGVARRMPREGRTRAYLDGSVASAAALDDRVSGFVDVIAQHDQLSLTRARHVRAMVDGALDGAGLTALDSYRAAWANLEQLRDTQRLLGGDRPALERELDLVTFQSDEIDGAGFQFGDDEQLEAHATRIKHGSEIVDSLSEASARLDQGREAVGEAVEEMRRAARLDPSLDVLRLLVEGVAADLDEATTEARRRSDDIDGAVEDPETVDARLTLLGDLKRKYGKSLSDVLEFATSAASRRDELVALLQRAGALDEELQAASQALAKAADELRDARRAAGARLADEAMAHLAELGFSDPLVRIDVEPGTPSASGGDDIRLQFASDRRLTPGDVSDVASGGELSRLVLALRLAGGTSETSTLVFDEIDAGIGGATALDLGRKLADLASDHQVLCVTHLPQVAAFAARHYVIRRVGVSATVSLVEGDERLAELSRMLAGLPDSDKGRDAANELLALASR